MIELARHNKVFNGRVGKMARLKEIIVPDEVGRYNVGAGEEESTKTST